MKLQTRVIFFSQKNKPSPSPIRLIIFLSIPQILFSTLRVSVFRIPFPISHPFLFFVLFSSLFFTTLVTFPSNEHLTCHVTYNEACDCNFVKVIKPKQKSDKEKFIKCPFPFWQCFCALSQNHQQLFEK